MAIGALSDKSAQLLWLLVLIVRHSKEVNHDSDYFNYH